MFFEAKSENLDWSKFEIKCNSNVPLDRGGFPEMDSYLWCSLEQAETLLHYTQASCIPKIKELLKFNFK